MKNKILNWINRDKKIIIISLMTGFIITTGVSFVTMKYSDNIQKDISEKVLRLHVLANSNSEEDQNLKINVKDEILRLYSNKLIKSKTIDESRKVIKDNLKNIEEDAENYIKNQGYNYRVTASLEDTVFPTKYYGDISLPPGEYEALRIKIGEAEGENWWCVMFPPLCFVDVATEEESTASILEESKKLEKMILEEKLLIEKQNAESLKITEKSQEKQNIVYVNKTIPTIKNVGADINITVLENNETKEIIENNAKYENYQIKEITKEDIKIKDIKTKEEIVLKDKEEALKGSLANESKEILKNTLTEEELSLITNTQEKNIKVRFKIVEFWQNLKNKENKFLFTKKNS